MRFAVCIQQNVSRFDVSMQNAVFMCVMDRASYLRDELRRLANRHRPTTDHFVQLSAFDKLHAEIALTIPLAYFVDGNDAGMVETGGSFRFAAKALQVRFGGPTAQANHLERNRAIQTFLMGAINYALTASTDFLQQLVVAQLPQDLHEALHRCDVLRPF